MNGANNPLAAVIQAKHHRLLLSLRSKDRIIGIKPLKIKKRK